MFSSGAMNSLCHLVIEIMGKFVHAVCEMVDHCAFSKATRSSLISGPRGPAWLVGLCFEWWSCHDMSLLLVGSPNTGNGGNTWKIMLGYVKGDALIILFYFVWGVEDSIFIKCLRILIPSSEIYYWNLILICIGRSNVLWFVYAS